MILNGNCPPHPSLRLPTIGTPPALPPGAVALPPGAVALPQDAVALPPGAVALDTITGIPPAAIVVAVVVVAGACTTLSIEWCFITPINRLCSPNSIL